MFSDCALEVSNVFHRKTEECAKVDRLKVKMRGRMEETDRNVGTQELRSCTVHDNSQVTSEVVSEEA